MKMVCMYDLLNDEVLNELGNCLDEHICDCYTKPLSDAGGYRTGNLWFIGGQTNAGKTQFAVGEMIHLAKNNKKVLYISTEMDEVDIIKRVRTATIGVNMDVFKNINYCSCGAISELADWCSWLTHACYIYDVIFIDYVIPNLISTKKMGGCGNYWPEDCPDDQKIVLMLEWFRKIIRGYDLYYKPGEEETRKFPCLVVLSQLNRQAQGGNIPDASVIQGSYSAANKADLAANLLWATDEERTLAPKVSRIMYVYKNRQPGAVNQHLAFLQYVQETAHFVECGSTNSPNWKKLGRK